MRNKYAAIITIIAVLQLYMLVYVESSQLLFLPVNHGSVIESVGVGWLLSVLAAEGLSFAAGAKAGHGLLGLAAGISLSTIPIVVLSMMESVYAAIPLYIIALFIATASVSSAKNLSYPSSIAVALSILLISIAAFTIALGPIPIIPLAICSVLIAFARLGYLDVFAMR